MKKIIVCTALAMLLSTNVLAAEVETHVNYDTRDVTVSGTIEQAAFNRMVSVIVDDDTNQFYVNTVGTDTDGSYELTFRMPAGAETGNYNVTVDALGLGSPVKRRFYFAKGSDIANVLNIINNSADASAILKEIEPNIDVLNVPGNWYSTLDNEGKLAVAEALYKAKPYAAIGDATTAAVGELAVQAFRCAGSADGIESALNEFADVYNINGDTAVCYELYNSFGYKQEANAIMAGYDCGDAAGVIKAYNESTLLAAINNAKDPLNIKSLISEYKSVIPFSMDTYDKSNLDNTVTYLYKSNSFNSMTALESAINAAYKQQTDNSGSGGVSGGYGGSGGSGGGGGRSGGSSSGSGGRINLPPVIDQVPNPQSNDTEPNPSDSGAFDDLDGVEWAREAIEYLADKNIVNGTGNNKFEPDNPVTREQFVVMIMNAFNMNDSAAACDFEDMPSTHWAYGAVASACARGIILGINDREFGTGNEITRQDMAVIAYRAAKEAGYIFENTNELDFIDAADISDYAKEGVAAMSSKGIINGYPDARFAPADTATRAQAAQVIYAIIK